MNWIFRCNGKQITPRAEEGYCNEASQSHQAKKGGKKTDKGSYVVLYVLWKVFHN
jgi:hypothetical protein